MLSNIFNYDNPVWRFMGKFCDILLLNILWTLCSIPIVTIGASTTAVYYVTLKLVRDEEGPTVRSFFRSFKENFKQATVIWLILLVAGLLIGFDLYFFLMLRTGASAFRTVMVAIFGAFALIYLFIALFIFPLQARFYSSVKRTFLNAFFVSVRHCFHSLGLIGIDIALPLVALFFLPILQPILFLFGFPLVAFINSFAIVGVFDKYMPKEEEPEETELPEPGQPLI